MRPPPGYPFEGDIPSQPPPAGREAEHVEAASTASVLAFVLVFAATMMAAGFLLVAVVASEARHAAQASLQGQDESQRMSLPPAGDSELEGVDTPRVIDAPAPPPPAMPPSVTRSIPVFPARFLEGCSSADIDSIERTVTAAVTVGSPLYNDGDVLGCADVYEAAARHLEGALPVSCGGPIDALSRARSTAVSVSLPSARAWALRDAFDGLISVMDRSRAAGGSL